MSDAIERLAHDHADVNRRVLAIGSELRKQPATNLAEPLAQLRDVLFHHFASEEEGLFPFVASALPELAARVDAMAVAHDTICGSLARMVQLAAEGKPLGALFERFEAAYAEHHAAEADVFAELERRLGRDQRAALRALLTGL
jgi:iron-sulfur cluster repair protein YtfE (RIC family)